VRIQAKFAKLTILKESISDYVERPLYPLRSGDLGISAESLEASLSEAFTLGERWNAIILLDEADVFLETRRRNELLRNSLVSGKRLTHLVICENRALLISL
jgi:hypothetical protein